MSESTAPDAELKEPSFGPVTGRTNDEGAEPSQSFDSSSGRADDPASAPEEDNRAAAPNDPRAPGETQPPTREEY